MNVEHDKIPAPAVVDIGEVVDVSVNEKQHSSSHNRTVLAQSLATPLATGCDPLTNSSGSKFAPLSPLQTQFGPLSTVPLPLGS